MNDTPELVPMPGRVIVKLNERLDKVPGTDMALDQRYSYQPYAGEVIAIGEPLNDQQAVLVDELKKRISSGQRAISTWGNGIEYGSKETYELRVKKEDGSYCQPFEWLSCIRIFRIDDFAATLKGGGPLGGSDGF